MRDELPRGTVTLMFTDIEGSTALLHQLGPVDYATALQRHREIVRVACGRYSGAEVDTQGDAFFVAFPTAVGAVAAAREIQAALAADGEVRIRIGLHTGMPLLVDAGYVGDDLHLGARIAAAGHGGQVLLSATTCAAAGDDADITPLGEHRLKDFALPVPLFQLGAEAFAPLKTLTNTNLPYPASPLVGRATELSHVLALVGNGARLLTLTGPGGTGKTRLALEAAAELLGEMNGAVFWAGLSSLQDPALVLPTVAQAIGASGNVASVIGQRRMLILLDNLEHVVAVAPELATLVESCPNLILLVTTRELLRVRGEVEYAVPPLDADDAVQLFCARSTLTPTHEISELCRRLDNLPLAVELAASRARVLSPVQILERMAQRLDLLKGGRDADLRQQTLRATIDWSFELLSPEEQRLFSRLGVFAGGATLDAAETVAGGDVDLIAALLDKSLLRNTDGRFWMLETIRQYALEHLAATDEQAGVRRAHADHFLAVAEQLEPQVLGLRPKAALDRLEAEIDNLRAALDWLEDIGDTQTALRLAGALWEFWCLRTHFDEGFKRLERLLAADSAPTAARAKALNGAAHLSPSESAEDWAEEAIAVNRLVGDPWGVAFAEYERANGLAQRGDFAGCLPLMEQSVERWREVGDEHRELQALRLVGWCANELGDPERQRRLHHEIVERAERIGDDEGLGWSLAVLAGFAAREGRQPEAVALLRRAWEAQENIGDFGVQIMTYARVATVVVDADARLSARIFGLVDKCCEEAHFTLPAWFSKMLEPARETIRGALDESTVAAEGRAGRSLTPDEVFILAADTVLAPVETGT